MQPNNYFTQAEKDRYTHLIECNKAEREGRPQPAPRYTPTKPTSKETR